MSPEKARVFVAEDDKDWQDIIKECLEEAGHTVVLTASTRKQALEAVDRFGELGVSVASIDGNLNEHDSDGADGRALLQAIKARAPQVKTVGMSGGKVNGVDVNVGKMDASKLGEVVKKL